MVGLNEKQRKKVFCGHSRRRVQPSEAASYKSEYGRKAVESEKKEIMAAARNSTEQFDEVKRNVSHDLVQRGMVLISPYDDF